MGFSKGKLRAIQLLRQRRKARTPNTATKKKQSKKHRRRTRQSLTRSGQQFNGRPRPFVAASLLRGAKSRTPPPYVHSRLVTDLAPSSVHLKMGTKLCIECGIEARVGLVAQELTQHDAVVVSQSWASKVKTFRPVSFTWTANSDPPAAGTLCHPCDGEPGCHVLPDGCGVV